MFVDWLSCYQDFENIEVFADSLVQRINHENGELQWSNFVGKQHEGSYKSQLRIRSDGRRLEVSGNPSRWNKSNNLFGVRSVEAAIAVFNTVLADMGLPTFWVEDRTTLASRQLQSSEGLVRSGVTLTRVDLTQNYSSGGRRNSEKVLHSLRSFRYRNQPPTDYGSSLIWGTGSRRLSFKYYLKAPEIKKHLRDSDKRSALVDFCEQEGVVRFEVCLKSMALKDRGLDTPDAWTFEVMGNILSSYALHNSCVNSIGSYMEIRDILLQHGLKPARAEKAQMAALSYIAGHDIKSGCSRATYYRLRNDLLLVGIDISAEVNISSLKFSVESLSLVPLSEPSWYSSFDADIESRPRLKLV